MLNPTARQHARTETDRLVHNFERQIAGHRLASFNETQTRRDFLDPWLAALGWDTENRRNLPQPLREVYMEAQVLVAGKVKFPDYEFRIDGQPSFFLEAKKPSVNLHDDWKPANQIRLYSWSAKLPVGVLTDFEELSIYDCRHQPAYQDPADVARHRYLTYDTYPDHFDYIYDLLGREAVAAGALQTLAQALPNQRGTLSVDKAFLATLELMRERLAQALARHNRHLTAPELRFLVQALLDRIIFLRIAEDRGIEPYQNLLRVLDSAARLGSDAPYEALLGRFREAQNRYNSGLFDLKADTLSARVKLPHLELKPLLENLYYPYSPYQFSVMGADILGSAYERFLGKVIDVPQPGRVLIEDKPAVRKAGGVYYTPGYIVRYLVQHTLGPLCAGRTPAQVARLRVLDPACGSGSFLLGAYEYLLNWHLLYYQANPKAAVPPASSAAAVAALPPAPKKNAKARPADAVLTATGQLGTAVRKRILLNNIFGVDLDEQAVEVSKLSLLLRCLEGETAQAPAAAQLAYDRLLPTLDANVRCGNSLVGPDYFDQPDASPDVNPFDWHTEFADVFAQGGFDAVIGNPPWVDLKGHPSELISYYFQAYKTASNRVNLYALFIEQATYLVKQVDSSIGVIIPNSLLYQSSYTELRKLLLEKFPPSVLIRLPDNTFEHVKAESLMLIASPNAVQTEVLVYDRGATISEIGAFGCLERKTVFSTAWKNTPQHVFDIFSSNAAQEICTKMESLGSTLNDLCEFCLGLTPYDKYRGHSPEQIKGRSFHSKESETPFHKPLLAGGDVSRYSVNWQSGEYIKYGPWLGAPREARFFSSPRILVRQIVSGKPPRIYAGYVEKELYNTQSLFAILLRENNTAKNLKLVLSILNSKLMTFYHANKFLDQSKVTFQKILIQDCKQLPFISPDIISKAAHDAIVTQVTRLLELHPQLAAATVPSLRQPLATRVRRAEEALDELVFDLYGLTAAERAVVRGEPAGAPPEPGA